MFIQNCLTPTQELLLMRSNQTVAEALATFESHQLESVPVIDGDGHFMGICSYTTIMKALLAGGKELSTASTMQVGGCLDKSVGTLTMEDIFESTLPIIVRYPFVPIVDDKGVFLGIVKRGDIELALETMFALRVPGIRFLLASLEIKGELQRVIETVTDHKHNVLAALSFDAGDRYARRIMIKIDEADDTEAIAKEFEQKGFRVLSVLKK